MQNITVLGLSPKVGFLSIYSKKILQENCFYYDATMTMVITKNKMLPIFKLTCNKYCYNLSILFFTITMVIEALFFMR